MIISSVYAFRLRNRAMGISFVNDLVYRLRK